MKSQIKTKKIDLNIETVETVGAWPTQQLRAEAAGERASLLSARLSSLGPRPKAGGIRQQLSLAQRAPGTYSRRSTAAATNRNVSSFSSIWKFFENP